MLRWLRRGLGRTGQGSLGALLNGADEIFHGTALRAREDLQAQHNLSIPAPSPGDRLLEDGVIEVGRVTLSDLRARGAGSQDHRPAEE